MEIKLVKEILQANDKRLCRPAERLHTQGA
jgi:hypothetical protein